MCQMCFPCQKHFQALLQAVQNQFSLTEFNTLGVASIYFLHYLILIAIHSDSENQFLQKIKNQKSNLVKIMTSK